MAFVCSTKARAMLSVVDSSKALQMPGVVDFVTHKDVPGSNVYGIGKDDLAFAVNEVSIYMLIARSTLKKSANCSPKRSSYPKLDALLAKILFVSRFRSSYISRKGHSQIHKKFITNRYFIG